MFFYLKDKCFIPDSRVVEKSAVCGSCGIAQGCKVIEVMTLQVFYIRNLVIKWLNTIEMSQLESTKTRAESSRSWLKNDQWYPSNKENLQIISLNNCSSCACTKTFSELLLTNIKVIRGKWLGRPVNIKEANNQATFYVENSLTLHIFFYPHWLCMSYIIAMLLLVGCMSA